MNKWRSPTWNSSPMVHRVSLLLCATWRCPTCRRQHDPTNRNPSGCVFRGNASIGCRLLVFSCISQVFDMFPGSSF